MEANCIESRRKRAKKNPVKFDLDQSKRKNQLTFETYFQSEYARYRIETFKPMVREQTIATIVGRVNN